MSDVKLGNRKGTLTTIVALIIIAILSLGFVAYVNLNPHVATVTREQLLTNTQNLYSTQTETSITTTTNTYSVTTSIAYASMINTVVGYGGYGSSIYYNCAYYGCSPPSLGAFGTLCPATGQNNTVTCSGYLSEPGNGCIQLAIPYTNPDLLESTAYLFYTLRNVPSAVPPAGSWITVTGQFGQGYTPGLNGAACPGNYINVSAISP